MKDTVLKLKKNLDDVGQWNKAYKALRKHLDKNMPVGFPGTFSGVEIRLLKAMFSPDEARLALHLDYRFVPAETVIQKAAADGLTAEDVTKRLDSMDAHGCLFAKVVDGVKQYALVPFVIGMYEMQLSRLNAGFYQDTREYVSKVYGLEYLSSAIPQMRVIPVAKSITPEHNIATYDEVRDIIEKTEKQIGIAECICRKARDSMGQACEATDRREVCLGFRDFHDTYSRHGWGRSISKEEALEILEQSQKDGLVLQPSNEQEPQFICACCACCCGVLEMMSVMPRPADFAATNYYAVLDTDLCNGCGKCVKACQMGAITIKDKKAILEVGRCIGCGLCVPGCKTDAIQLKKKATEVVPPKTTEDLYETIMQNRKSSVKKYLSVAGAVLKGRKR